MATGTIKKIQESDELYKYIGSLAGGISLSSTQNGGILLMTYGSIQTRCGIFVIRWTSGGIEIFPLVNASSVSSSIDGRTITLTASSTYSAMYSLSEKMVQKITVE